jgi:hypothetical protein
MQNTLFGTYWWHVPARGTRKKKQATHRVAPAVQSGVVPSRCIATPTPAIASNFKNAAEIEFPTHAFNLQRPCILQSCAKILQVAMEPARFTRFGSSTHIEDASRAQKTPQIRCTGVSKFPFTVPAPARQGALAWVCAWYCAAVMQQS